MRISFILSSLQLQRVVKRINSFVDAGYDVEVFAFVRKDEPINHISFRFKYEIIGEFSNKISYLKRLPILYNSVKKIASLINKDNLVYYFGIDVAIIGRLLISNKYVYEEADLVHTYIGNKLISFILEKIDCRIIKKSAISVMTSEGFAKFHFGNNIPQQVLIIPNKLNKDILKYKSVQANEINLSHIKFGFVGALRFMSVYNFCKVIVDRFPQHEFHVYGIMSDDNKFSKFLSCSNFYYHGIFKNPSDLPDVYSGIDIVVSTYDNELVNVQYAEPNKLYEAIYFEKPIVVSTNTFLFEKVKKMNVGYGVNCQKEDFIEDYINSLTYENYKEKKDNMASIDKAYCVDDITVLFKTIDSLNLR